MIVISGALVLVALVLLVLGVTMQGLDFVYASIAVSLVSLIFLVIGILQRRGGASAPQAAPRPAPVSVRRDDAAERPTAERPRAERPRAEREVTAVIAAPPARSVPAKTGARGSVAVQAPVEEDVVGGGTVLVVAGRPRYHVDGCRYLAGKPAEELDVIDALDEGFTPCGVCKPDDALLTGYDDEPYDDEALEDEPYEDEPLEDEPLEDEMLEDEMLEDEMEDEPARVTARNPAASQTAARGALPAAGTGRFSKAAYAKPGVGTAVKAVPVVGETDQAPARKPISGKPVPGKAAKARSVEATPAPAERAPASSRAAKSAPSREAKPAPASTAKPAAGATAKSSTPKAAPTSPKTAPTSSSKAAKPGLSKAASAMAGTAKPGASKPAPVKAGAFLTAAPGLATQDKEEVPGTVAPKGTAKPALSKAASAMAGTAKPGASKPAPGKDAPGKTAPTKASRAAARPGSPVPPSARKTSSVVVIPDRNRYHRDDCRFVRGVDDAEVLTKAQASRQGYDACGVCKP
ncbi:MAG: hypothetical protein ACR2K2_09360 [Mycobacteriales bacterium]